MKNKYFQYIADELNIFGAQFGAYWLMAEETRKVAFIEAKAENSKNRRIIIIRKGNDL